MSDGFLREIRLDMVAIYFQPANGVAVRSIFSVVADNLSVVCSCIMLCLFQEDACGSSF